jgi:hypothetical protein
VCGLVGLVAYIPANTPSVSAGGVHPYAWEDGRRRWWWGQTPVKSLAVARHAPRCGATADLIAADFFIEGCVVDAEVGARKPDLRTALGLQHLHLEPHQPHRMAQVHGPHRERVVPTVRKINITGGNQPRATVCARAVTQGHRAGMPWAWHWALGALGTGQRSAGVQRSACWSCGWWSRYRGRCVFVCARVCVCERESKGQP